MHLGLRRAGSLIHTRAIAFEYSCALLAALAGALVSSPSIADEADHLSFPFPSSISDVDLGNATITTKIDYCHLEIITEYEGQCKFPGEVRTERKVIDLRSVGRIEIEAYKGSTFLSFLPIKYFGFYIPGATVKSEIQFEHCSGEVSTTQGGSFEVIILQGDGGEGVGQKLIAYARESCKSN